MQLSFPFEALSTMFRRAVGGVLEEPAAKSTANVAWQQPEVVKLGDLSVLNQRVETSYFAVNLEDPDLVLADVVGIERDDLREASQEFWVVAPVPLGGNRDLSQSRPFFQQRPTKANLVIVRQRCDTHMITRIC